MLMRELLHAVQPSLTCANSSHPGLLISTQPYGLNVISSAICDDMNKAPVKIKSGKNSVLANVKSCQGNLTFIYIPNPPLSAVLEELGLGYVEVHLAKDIELVSICSGVIIIVQAGVLNC